MIGGKHTHPEHLDADLGRDYAIERVWIKVYPCCGLIHSTMNALEDLKREHRLTVPDVRKVREAVASQDAATAHAGLKATIKQLSKAASKGVLHKNAAARRIGRLSKQVAALQPAS